MKRLFTFATYNIYYKYFKPPKGDPTDLDKSLGDIFNGIKKFKCIPSLIFQLRFYCCRCTFITVRIRIHVAFNFNKFYL